MSRFHHTRIFPKEHGLAEPLLIIRRQGSKGVSKSLRNGEKGAASADDPPPGAKK
jgi:hypothetical protein